jgi:predicted dehydrogenase
VYKSAIIGVGQIGYKIDFDPNRKFIWSHSKAYSCHKLINLVAISDSNDKYCQNFSTDFPDVKTYNSYLKMLDEHEIQIVSICAPTKFHFSIVNEISKYESVKAIFIEKPVGNSYDDCLNIKRICEEKNIILASNYMRRWDSKYQYIKEIINNNQFGKMQTIVAYGATSMLTSASHLIDLMLFYGGDTSLVFGELQKDYVRKVNGIDDHGSVAFIKFKKGGFGFLKALSKNNNNFMFELDILFEDGRLTINEPWINDDQSLIKVMNFLPRNNNSDCSYRCLKPYLNKLHSNERMIDAITDIISCIQDGRLNPLSNGKNALEVHKVIRDIKNASLNLQVTHSR